MVMNTNTFPKFPEGTTTSQGSPTCETVEKYQSRFENGRFCQLIGSSAVMQSVYQIIGNAAKSKATVFITGESGTGKELCASAVHQCSDRQTKPFIAINCAAIPKDLIESEIFGHVKGAFTGATNNRRCRWYG